MDLLNEHALSKACKGQGHRGHRRCLPCSCALTSVLVSHLCTVPAPMAPLHLRDGSCLWGQITLEKFFVCFWGLFTESALLDWKFRVVAVGGQQPGRGGLGLWESPSRTLKMPRAVQGSAFLSEAGSALGGPSCLGQTGLCKQPNKALALLGVVKMETREGLS